MRRTRETFAFLCAVLSFVPLGSRRDDLRHALAAGRISWPWLARMASEHQVSPGVFMALGRCGLRDGLPADLQDYFEAIATLNRERNRRIRRESLSLAGMLNGLGILPIFLKGTADLLTGLRPDPGERMQQDIDVLVPADALNDCIRLLQRNGYESQVHTSNPLSHQAAPLWRTGDAATIELHSDVLAYPFADLLPADAVRKAAERVTCDGVTVGVPSPFGRAVHIVGHAQLVDLGLAYGRLELRQLLDLAHLAERHPGLDWEAVHRHFASHRQLPALQVFLRAARHLVGATVPEPKAPSRMVALQCRRALWQTGAPRVTGLMVRLLRPPLLLNRSLSSKAHRHRLVRNLTDRRWLKRQARHLVG